ncbi:OTU domain-containing protein 4 [Anabas testudineus]|uniref:ubiquitinyl hydrolase 1 n=1 Tax=Anabas testudineus TaxID=64144 RepID=A0A3Q1JFS9_ANATE|nr:OTU domain-containing protein 4 [Anabas testudineus]
MDQVMRESNDERGADKLMDDYLKTLGLHRKRIAKDGSCLFRAVAEQVLHCQSLHTEVRAQCVEFLKKNREVYEAFVEGDFEDYLCKLQDPQQWVGEVEINALAVMYKRDFLIYQEPGKPAVPITDNNFKEKVRLCFLNGNHYDSVYPISHIKNTAVCQSILYELLYDGVFKVDRSTLSTYCQRNSRPNDLVSDDNMPACVSSDESELDPGDVFRVENGSSTTSTKHSHKGRGRGQVSHRVKRSLNPTLYRNIEYDVWQKTKKAQQKIDYCIAAGMQYTVGDRCQVRLEGSGRSYNATIKEAPPNSSYVIVYIEELGKRQVPLWCVCHPSDENSWSTVVNRDKRLSNGHGDWEERGKGRGRGKSNAASSSVSQATAPGSGGRVQKQHSWPQATVEEQGGTKTSRKSQSTVDSALFGLTEEERLAKEEEERNVALVEIQLRDEHSFPALGTQHGMQSDGGKRKGGEKRRSQRNKTKSPVEDVRAPSPSAGERPKCSTPSLAATTAAPTTTTTNPANPPAAKPLAAVSTKSNSSPAQPSSLKASTPNTNTATAAPGSSSRPPLACAAPTTKTNAHSYASAAFPAPSSPPAAAPSTKPTTGGAPPHSVPSSASVFSFVTPVLPAASPIPSFTSSPSSSSSKLPKSCSSSQTPKSSASPPPSSSVPPPTFIAPIAPSPVAAQGYLATSSFPRSHPHSPSPPSFTPSADQNSSSSVVHHAAQTQEAPPASVAQTPDSLPHAETPPAALQIFHNQSSLSQTHHQEYQPQNQASLPQAEISSQPSTEVQTQSQPSIPQNNILRPQIQTEVQSSVPHLQHQPQTHTEAASLPQTQIQPPVLQTQMPLQQAQVSISQSQAKFPPHTQSEFTQVQSSHPAPGASYPHVPQGSVSASVQPQPPVTQSQLHSQLVQPPHPSQVPHPSLSLSAFPTHPSVQSQTTNTQNKTEAPLPAAQLPQPQPESQQSQPPHPPLHSAHPPQPHPQSMPGAVPLQQLSQLYLDPLYPGFPQDENGTLAPTPPFSSNKSGEDLPQDVNILRFFFNLGVKAYSVPIFPPCMYLMPLQQAYTMHPKLSSRSPSPTPHFAPSNPPARHQEPYPQYPQNSASAPTQYDHQAPVTGSPHPSEPSFNQAAYPVTQPPPHRMQWQQQQVPPPRNSSYSVGYPSTTPPYPLPQPSPQGFPSGQDPGHPPYPPPMSTFPPSSLGYHQSPTPEEFQGSHHLQAASGDTIAGHGLGRVPGPLEGPAAANVTNANNNRTMVVHGYGFKNEQEESVLLVDPPLNNTPIHVTMTTMKSSSIAGSHDIVSKPTVSMDNNPSHVYRGARKPYVKPGAIAMAEGLSVGCSTEDDWEEKEVFNHPSMNHRGPRKSNRGGRGRGGHDGGRVGQRRRQDMGGRFIHNQFAHSHGGQGWGTF